MRNMPTHATQVSAQRTVGQPAMTMQWVPVTDPRGHTRLEARWTSGPVSVTDGQHATHAA